MFSKTLALGSTHFTICNYYLITKQQDFSKSSQIEENNIRTLLPSKGITMENSIALPLRAFLPSENLQAARSMRVSNITLNPENMHNWYRSMKINETTLHKKYVQSQFSICTGATALLAGCLHHPLLHSAKRSLEPCWKWEFCWLVGMRVKRPASLQGFWLSHLLFPEARL